jgi:hypothetical protein
LDPPGNKELAFGHLYAIDLDRSREVQAKNPFFVILVPRWLWNFFEKLEKIALVPPPYVFAQNFRKNVRGDPYELKFFGQGLLQNFEARTALHAKARCNENHFCCNAYPFATVVWCFETLLCCWGFLRKYKANPDTFGIVRKSLKSRNNRITANSSITLWLRRYCIISKKC